MLPRRISVVFIMTFFDMPVFLPQSRAEEVAELCGDSVPKQKNEIIDARATKDYYLPSLDECLHSACTGPIRGVESRFGDGAEGS